MDLSSNLLTGALQVSVPPSSGCNPSTTLPGVQQGNALPQTKQLANADTTPEIHGVEQMLAERRASGSQAGSSNAPHSKGIYPIIARSVWRYTFSSQLWIPPVLVLIDSCS